MRAAPKAGDGLVERILWFSLLIFELPPDREEHRDTKRRFLRVPFGITFGAIAEAAEVI
jgi:hypothetical protein